jgi:hypothetical protein
MHILQEAHRRSRAWQHTAWVRAEVVKLCRAATDRQIALDRKKRQEIERAKEVELEVERGQLSRWQQQLNGDHLDESDGEEDGEILHPVRCPFLVLC